MTYYQQLCELKRGFFESASFRMTEDDYKHRFDFDYEFSQIYSEKLTELKDCGKDIFNEYVEWLKLATGKKKGI